MHARVSISESVCDAMPPRAKWDGKLQFRAPRAGGVERGLCHCYACARAYNFLHTFK